MGRHGMGTVEALIAAAQTLSTKCDQAIKKIEENSEVAHATNPLDYAWPHHVQYLEQWGGLGASVLMLGMNPGPWGMAQTGVPFGATDVAQQFLGIEPRALLTPPNAHPKRPIEWMAL